MTSDADSVITPEAAAALCDAYLTGLVVGDLEAVLALFSPDAVVEDPVGSEPQQGMEALRVFYQIACDSVSNAERIGRRVSRAQTLPLRSRSPSAVHRMPCVSTSLTCSAATALAKCVACAPTGGRTTCEPQRPRTSPFRGGRVARHIAVRQE